MTTRVISCALCIVTALALVITSQAQNAGFHNAPASARNLQNPYDAKPPASAKALYEKNCSGCHGPTGAGTGNVPPISSGPTQSASDGEVFWFITHGDVANGMPAWDKLPAQERWEMVSYVKSLSNTSGAASSETPLPTAPVSGTAEDAKLPAPQPPFTDFRYEKPGVTRKISLADLPRPYATKSAEKGPKGVQRPANAWPQVPPGFKVELFASDLKGPRLIRRAPNGDLFVAEMRAGDVKVFRGMNGEGKPEQVSTFAEGLNEPFGINFYPSGANPEWVYIGDTDAVLRFPYQNGDLKARGQSQHLADLPHGSHGHSTRDIQFTPDGKKMLVSVGSASNVDDPDTTPDEKNRADILEYDPDGSHMRIFAYGIRNAVGLAVNPTTGELWCSVNERDGLGDDLVPDYITHVQPGGFYGWPWWYMGPHQDPRHEGKHPELKDKVITPDVILNPHNASLEMTFYDGKQFPAEYAGDIFASEHGSWNRSVRVGYELIRVPLHQTGHATGEYEDFMTGFVVDNEHAWGRPVGVAVAPDGSLLVTDDVSNSIWRITYTK